MKAKQLFRTSSKYDTWNISTMRIWKTSIARTKKFCNYLDILQLILKDMKELEKLKLMIEYCIEYFQGLNWIKNHLDWRRKLYWIFDEFMYIYKINYRII